MNDWKYLQARFVLLYALLGVFVCAAGFGAYKGLVYRSYQLPPTVAHTADIEKALGETSIVKTACDFLTASAGNQGVTLVACKKKSLVLKGNAATVVVVARDNHGSNYTVEVKLAKGVWTGQSFEVKG